MKKVLLFLVLGVHAYCYPHESVENPDAWRSKVFTYIYQANHWKDAESHSGPGSTVAVTHELRSLLPAILKALQIESLLDAGCGDFNWMKEVDLGISYYLGADIVESLCDSNQERYGNSSRSFVCLDITKDYIPAVDAVMSRDCLAHLSHTDIKKALLNIKKSGARYLIASNFPGVRANSLDIRTGDFRPVNLCLAPFNLPQPIMSFVELSAEPAMKRAGKCLSVWRLEDIAIEA